MTPLKDRPYLLLTMAVLFWAGNFILGRAFHAEIPPVALAFWRWIGAALLVTWPALPYLRRDHRALINSWPVVLILSFLGIACFNTLAYSGLQYTEAINAFLLQSMMPVLIVLLSFLIFRERVTRLQSLGITVSLCGAVLIIARGDILVLQSLSFNRGDLLVFAAIACYAGYSVMLRKRPQAHPLAFIATTFWVGSLILVPLYIWETLTVATLVLTPATIFVLGYVMVFPSIVSYLCFNRGVELVGANWYHGVGVVSIGLGIYLATRKQSAAGAA
jgi:drug/metabolite transporter (DMT)-like permease